MNINRKKILSRFCILYSTLQALEPINRLTGLESSIGWTKVLNQFYNSIKNYEFPGKLWAPCVQSSMVSGLKSKPGTRHRFVRNTSVNHQLQTLQ
jgi:hypothetical protein